MEGSPAIISGTLPGKLGRVLLADSDRVAGSQLESRLSAAGYAVSTCVDGETALLRFRQDRFDLCLLDLVLSGLDGLRLARAIRRENPLVPLIFLSTQNQVSDRLNGFKAGADDYLAKPCDFHELLYRMQAVLRRRLGAEPDTGMEKRIGSYVFFPFTRELVKDGEVKVLSAKEAALLDLFIDHKNQLLPRQHILETVWGEDNFFHSKSMDVYLTRIRKLFLKDPDLTLVNIHGTGYRFVVR